MRGFATYHPAAILIYFLSVITITMFINHPVLLLLSFVGAWIYNLLTDRRSLKGSIGFDLVIFTVITLANPVFTHRGRTVLFFINGRMVTLEAMVYGVSMAVMMLGVIHWCRALTKVMTSDKLLHLCGRLAPNLSIILSMTLRYIPLFKLQSVKVSDSQTAMGLYSGDTYMTKAKGSLRIFSVVLTWSMENAIDTANSMRARGYGLGKRSQYSMFRITKEDIALIILSVLLTGIIFTGSLRGTFYFGYYPELGQVYASAGDIVIYIACGWLVLLPVLIELKEKLRWNLYRSRI